MSTPITVGLKATQLVSSNNNDTKPKLVPPIVVNAPVSTSSKKKSNNTVGKGMAGVKLNASTHTHGKKKRLGVDPDSQDVVDEDTISEEESQPEKKKAKSSSTSDEEAVEEAKFPSNTTWFPENWRNQTISKLKDGPVQNIFIYWEKLFGLYGVSYKLLNNKGQYFWSTSDVVHWLETGICDMTKENLCTKRLGNGKILCGKCDKTSDDKDALSKVVH